MYKLCWRSMYVLQNVVPTLGDLWEDSHWAFAEAHASTKASLLREYAAELGVEYVDIPVKHCSAEDLKGILFMDELPTLDDCVANFNKQRNEAIDEEINDYLAKAGYKHVETDGKVMKYKK